MGRLDLEDLSELDDRVGVALGRHVGGGQGEACADLVRLLADGLLGGRELALDERRPRVHVPVEEVDRGDDRDADHDDQDRADDEPVQRPVAGALQGSCAVHLGHLPRRPVSDRPMRGPFALVTMVGLTHEGSHPSSGRYPVQVSRCADTQRSLSVLVSYIPRAVAPRCGPAAPAVRLARPSRSRWRRDPPAGWRSGRADGAAGREITVPSRAK